ncbi:MAG: ABC transporter ATP-binding protein [Candidatus Omnitrophica bacterium]|nr:ABC transporter ATP-binding protein [Candidatus Omnitrophota bacterium]
MFLPLVHLENLTVTVGEAEDRTVLLDRVNFEIPELSITALVGGSGSGKTTTGLAILRLLPLALNVEEGRIFFNGEDLLNASGERMRQIRGGEVSMVFQEPLNAFNPVFSIGYQIDEVLQIHTDLGRVQRQKRVLELLDLVGLPEPGRMARDYPHQLSGGMRQRAMIAQAIAGDPKLIIADEPTSNLDVTLQARIIELFKKLKNELKLSILLITHDLGMVGHMADHVAVMTQGKIVESGTTGDVLSSPQHQYTQRLMEALL